MKDLSKKTESKPESEQTIDVITALYVDKTPEEEEDIERKIAIFRWILKNETVEEAIQ